MDTTQYAEGQFISPELVKNSKSKKVYIAGDAEIVQGKFGDKLEVDVELDGKKKRWGLNRDQVKALHEFGKDSKLWVGKWVSLKVVNIGGKETVVAIPEQDSTEEVISD